MTPEQCLFLRDFLLPGLQREHLTTKGVLMAIPLDKGDYRPDAVTKPVLDLAWHVVAAEIRFLSGIADGGFDFTPMHRPASVTNSAELVSHYSAAFEAGAARVAVLGGEQLAKVLDFAGMFQLPAAVYLQFSQNHTIHHRGQLSMYLRPMGAKVPSIYGPSHDTAMAQKAEQA